MQGCVQKMTTAAASPRKKDFIAEVIAALKKPSKEKTKIKGKSSKGEQGKDTPAAVLRAEASWVKDKKTLPQKSIVDYLPYLEYDPDDQTFLLEDAKSLAACFELEAIGAEGKTEEFKAEVCELLLGVVADSVPLRDPNPWVLQFYVQDEFDLSYMSRRCAEYRSKGAEDTAYSNYFQEKMAAHFQNITREGGYFHDKTVTGAQWRGKRRRVRMCVFRRAGRNEEASDLEFDLSEVCENIQNAFHAAGVNANRMTGAEFYDWMVAWFNPRPEHFGGDVKRLLQEVPYPGDKNVPYGRDFAEMLFQSCPEADSDRGTVLFDGCPHTIITTTGVRQAPTPGHFTAERIRSERTSCFFDELPDDTKLVMTIVFRPQDLVENHIAKVERASLGGELGSSFAKTEAQDVKIKMAQGERLYPTEIAAYVSGKDYDEFRTNVNKATAALQRNGIGAISRLNELITLDRFFENLPMAYRPEKVEAHFRAPLHFGGHLAAMLPVVGRSRGTNNPGFIFNNRGGEPLTIDPLAKSDRSKNAHMVLLGPTGAGKSATLVHLLMSTMAAHRPRLFIIERGRSFSLLADLFKREGLTVNAVDLRQGSGVSLAPFSEAFRLLDMVGETKDSKVVAIDGSVMSLDDDEEEGSEDRRDLMGEIEIVAQLMITGGDKNESAKLTRADKSAIQSAILRGAQKAKSEGAATCLPVHIANALNELAREAESDEVTRRLNEMAEAMKIFCNPLSLAGQLFNRPGEAWPECDVTLVDLGSLADEGKEGELAVAYVSLMNTISAIVERDEYSDRSTVVCTDEGHMITTNSLLVKYVVKITKMWRKLGAWFWLATQNLEDFPDDARKMLNMAEFWLCLTMPKDEVQQMARFRELSPEQESMCRGARKADQQFTEGVLLCDALQVLVRIVPPSIALAIAQTEKHEKAHRFSLMKEHNLKTELEAAEMVAEELDRVR